MNTNTFLYKYLIPCFEGVTKFNELKKDQGGVIGTVKDVPNLSRDRTQMLHGIVKLFLN